MLLEEVSMNLTLSIFDPIDLDPIDPGPIDPEMLSDKLLSANRS